MDLKVSKVCLLAWYSVIGLLPVYVSSLKKAKILRSLPMLHKSNIATNLEPRLRSVVIHSHDFGVLAWAILMSVLLLGTW